MNKRRNLSEQPERGSEILFEDNKLIVAKILTQEAACYYAQDSSWCKENNFSKYNRIGDVYYFIPKNPKSMLKTALFVGDDNSVSHAFTLSNGDEISVSVLTLQFPQVKDIIGELYPFNITKNIEDYLMEIIDKDTLIELSPSIDTIFTSDEGRGLDEIVIKNNDTYDMIEKLMDLDYGDVVAFRVSQTDGEWADYDAVYEDISNGWAIYNAHDKETENILNEIATYLYFSYEEFDFENQSSLEYLMSRINDEFWDELGTITHEYRERLNSAVVKKIKEEAEDELNKYLDKLGFLPGPYFDELSTTIGNLLYWCRRYDYVGTLDNLIRIIFEKNKSNIGGWYEVANEVVFDGQEKEEYIQILNKNLNEILSKLKNN